MKNAPVSPRSRKDRDAGLVRVKSITRWSLAGALAGTGLFAGLAAQASAATASAKTIKAGTSPAASTSTKSKRRTSTSTATTPTTSATSGTSGTTVTTPETTQPITTYTVPAPSNYPPIIVSGAS